MPEFLLLVPALDHPGAAGGFLLRYGPPEAALRHQQAAGSHGSH